MKYRWNTVFYKDGKISVLVSFFRRNQIIYEIIVNLLDNYNASCYI